LNLNWSSYQIYLNVIINIFFKLYQVKASHFQLFFQNDLMSDLEGETQTLIISLENMQKKFEHEPESIYLPRLSQDQQSKMNAWKNHSFHPTFSWMLEKQQLLDKGVLDIFHSQTHLKNYFLKDLHIGYKLTLFDVD